VHLNPAQVKRLPPAIHDQFLHAFAHALNGVFLWGIAFTAIAFALSWFLEEVPLRTGRSTVEPPPAAAVAGASGTEALVGEPLAAESG